ncbi:MAG: hypothetical protein WAO02_10315 [Verrucomicrobiia bacterium]
MITTLRWSARILSILVVGILLVFAFGEGLNLSHFTARELLLFVCFPLGFCVGMVVAWWREGLGGGITVGSLAAFYLADRLLSSSYPRGWALVALAGPGFLFLLCGLWTRMTKETGK